MNTALFLHRRRLLLLRLAVSSKSGGNSPSTACTIAASKNIRIRSVSRMRRQFRRQRLHPNAQLPRRLRQQSRLCLAVEIQRISHFAGLRSVRHRGRRRLGFGQCLIPAGGSQLVVLGWTRNSIPMEFYVHYGILFWNFTYFWWKFRNFTHIF